MSFSKKLNRELHMLLSTEFNNSFEAAPLVHKKDGFNIELRTFLLEVLGQNKHRYCHNVIYLRFTIKTVTMVT